MADFADQEKVERRRLLQARKPKPHEIRDILVAPGTALPVEAASVASKSVSGRHIQANSISAKTIKAGTITADKIKARSITADRIVVGSLTATEIMAGTITANEIAAGTITADRIFAGTITANEIAANTITADRIAANTITANEIAANTITAGQIAATTITATQIAAGAITAGKIAAGAVQAGNLAAGAVLAGDLAAGAVLAGSIAAGAITAATIASGQITAAIIDVVSSGQIRCLDSGGDVRATMDASGFTVYGPDGVTVWMSPSSGVLTDGIASGAVGAGSIASLAVGSTHIAASAVVAGKIAAGAVTAGTIAAGAVVAASIAANQIDASHINSQTITGINIYASGFSNSATPAAQKYILDANGIHIRTSNAATGFQFLDFYDGSGVSRGQIQYDFYSGADFMTILSVGALSLVASLVYVNSSLRVNGHVRTISTGELQVEGAQSGVYAGTRFTATAGGQWEGAGTSFRARRTNGGGTPTAPSSVVSAADLTITNVAAVDVSDVTAYGCFFAIQSTGAGSCRYNLALVTN